MNNCFSIYHTSWVTSGPKSNFLCDNIATKAILFFFGCSEVNSTWLVTSELANQRARKVLFNRARWLASSEVYSLVWYILKLDYMDGNGLHFIKFDFVTGLQGITLRKQNSILLACSIFYWLFRPFSWFFFHCYFITFGAGFFLLRSTKASL